jgi:hypothetical protein
VEKVLLYFCDCGTRWDGQKMSPPTPVQSRDTEYVTPGLSRSQSDNPHVALSNYP